MKGRLGKIIGSLLGFIFGGIRGAVLGFILGHLHDIRAENMVNGKRSENDESLYLHPGLADSLERTTYTIGIIVLGAKMAKADGRVSRTEIEAFNRVFRVSPEQAVKVGRIFDQARISAEGFEPYAMRLAQVFRHNPLVLEEILTGLFIIAASDTRGVLSRAETLFLRRVASLFDFSVPDFERIAARSGIRLSDGFASSKPEKDPSYVVLGLPENAPDDLIKKTYRALIRKHHPDKLVAQGLPPELIDQATEKMKRINAAYDAICKKRGIK